MSINPILNPPIFEILIDCGLAEVMTEKNITISKESIFSLINDYEDKKWRFDKFQKYIWDNISETALSQKERESLIANPFSLLSNAAKKLRLTDAENDTGEGSEIAEILLYGILRHYFKALPIVPKIFYKQNTNDYAKGADSVHIVLNEEKTDFTLWFGEAKFYKRIDDSQLSKIVGSVKKSLNSDKIKKENSIITNLQDINLIVNPELGERIKLFLSDNMSLDIIRPKLHIPILLLYECKITAKYSERTDSFLQEIKDYHLNRAKAYFVKQIQGLVDIHKYSDIHFHLIIFPVPNKQAIVSLFKEQAVALRGIK
jgi:hypothetical protein